MFFRFCFLFYVDASLRVTTSLEVFDTFEFRKSDFRFFVSKLVCERRCHATLTDWLWLEFSKTVFGYFSFPSFIFIR